MELGVAVQKEDGVTGLVVEIDASGGIGKGVHHQRGITWVVREVGHAMTGDVEAAAVVVADLHPPLRGGNLVSVKPNTARREASVQLNLLVFLTGSIECLWGIEVAFFNQNSKP